MEKISVEHAHCHFMLQQAQSRNSLKRYETPGVKAGMLPKCKLKTLEILSLRFDSDFPYSHENLCEWMYMAM
jgi:hypothetical protein